MIQTVPVKLSLDRQYGSNKHKYKMISRRLWTTDPRPERGKDAISLSSNRTCILSIPSKCSLHRFKNNSCFYIDDQYREHYFWRLSWSSAISVAFQVSRKFRTSQLFISPKTFEYWKPQPLLINLFQFVVLKTEERILPRSVTSQTWEFRFLG